MDLDDDLPPPPQARPPAAITLDDSDDDLPPPPKPTAAPPAAAAVVLDDDDDDELPPPPPAAAAPQKSAAAPVIDSDDDLPPPPSKPSAAAASSAPPPTPPRSAEAAPPQPAAPPPQSSAPPPATPTKQPAAAAADTVASPSRPRSAVVVEPSPSPQRGGGDDAASDLSSVATRSRSVTSISRQKASFKDGVLLKQQPNWPYTGQNRWCVLANRQLSYYDSKESAASGAKASGTLDLKDAHLRTSADEVKSNRPHSFGIEVAVDPHAAAGKGNTGRTYIFSALSSEEFGAWIAVLENVCGTAKSGSTTELHWFEKLAQGTF